MARSAPNRESIGQIGQAATPGPAVREGRNGWRRTLRKGGKVHAQDSVAACLSRIRRSRPFWLASVRQMLSEDRLGAGVTKAA